jgi:hypothetical protein
MVTRAKQDEPSSVPKYLMKRQPSVHFMARQCTQVLHASGIKTTALSDCNGSGGVVSGPQHSPVHTAALSDCNGSGAIHLIRNCISRNIFDDEP